LACSTAPANVRQNPAAKDWGEMGPAGAKSVHLVWDQARSTQGGELHSLV